LTKSHPKKKTQIGGESQELGEECRRVFQEGGGRGIKRVKHQNKGEKGAKFTKT